MNWLYSDRKKRAPQFGYIEMKCHPSCLEQKDKKIAEKFMTILFRNYKPEDIAKQTGINKSTITSIFYRRGLPSRVNYAKLKKAYLSELSEAEKAVNTPPNGAFNE